MRYFLTFIALISLHCLCTAKSVIVPTGDTIVIDESVLSGSVFLLCNGDTVSPLNYAVSHTGTIYVDIALACDSVEIIYSPLSEVFPGRSRHRLLWGTGTVSSIQRMPDTAESEINFRTGGSLLRGLRVSNTGEVNSTSSLQFQAEGDLAGDIHISALLSDESSPIQPEGSSLEISELDKILIQLKSPHFAASFGDINLDFNGGDFLNLNRKIQGIDVSTEFQAIQAQGFGSIMRGQYSSIEFSAQEGNQGPYPLWGESGERNIVVLAGSERVWLNGELLKRGETNDYIIDYNLAQLTFSNTTPVGAGDRVVVDFQYISQDYSRLLFGAGVDIEPLSGMQLSVSGISQRDDSGNPLVEVSDSIMEILSQSGDSIPDSLSAPQSLSIISAGASMQKEGYSLDAEYAFSEFDRNLFSSQNDGDNLADAFSAAGTLAVLEWLSFFGGGRYISEKFEPLGRIDPADFDRNWNFSASDGDDRIIQGGLKTGTEKSEISTWVGRRIAGDLYSNRANLSGWYSSESFAANLNSNYSKSNAGSRNSQNLSFSIFSDKLKSSTTALDFDLFNSDTLADTAWAKIDQNFVIAVGSLNLGFNGAYSGYKLRRGQNFGDFSRTIEYGCGISGKFGSVSYTRRHYSAIDSAAGEDIKSDLIAMRASKTVLKVSLVGSYQLSRSQSETLSKIYTYAGEGEGYYSWDETLGEYISDTDGDYILEYEPTGEFKPVLRADGSFSTSAPLDFVPFGASLSGDISFHSENSRDGLSSYYLSPTKMFTDDSLSSGTFSATARAGFLQQAKVNLILTSSYRKTTYRIYSSGAELSSRINHTISVSADLPQKISTNLNGGIELNESYRPGLTGWVEAQKVFGQLSVSRRFFKALRFRMTSELASIVDRAAVPETDASQWDIGISETGVFGKFTIKSSAERVLLQSGISTLPYELSGGWHVGENFRWDASISYRAGQKTELSLIYTGEKKASTDSKHTAEIRVRLLF